MKEIVLTGIKPTGRPHLGNYIGAIKPAISRITEQNECYFFVADYHAITTVHDPDMLKDYIYDVAATWIALGLDPKKCLFYRQSRIPQITELNWLLACFTAKGLMNRAHAYKSLVAANEEKREKDLDKAIFMGLYTYPILMAADIIMFDTNIVPVGKDQVQHVEIARDIAQKINHIYKTELFTLPKHALADEGDVIPGLDGRKMSKSYDNTIPLFCPEKKLRKFIMKIKTDSKGVEDEKDPDECNLFQLSRHFMNTDELATLSEQYKSGIGYGDIKQHLFEKINETLIRPREIYIELMNDKNKLEAILAPGEEKAKKIAATKLEKIRTTIGII